MTERFYGAIPSPKDDRDYNISMYTPIKTEFAPNYMIPEKTTSVYDQGAYGMCVAFSLSEIKEIQEAKERGINTRYSPAFIYGNRVDGDWMGEGMISRQALARLTADGVCDFDSLSLIDTYPSCRDAISAYHRNIARNQIVSSYILHTSPDAVRTALMKFGAVLLITDIYSSFESNGQGIVPQIQGGETLLGSHAMIIVGWKTIEGQLYWVVQNSWGDWWCDKGFCYIPVNYSAIQELWSIADYTPPITERVVTMPEAMILSAKGNTFLPLRPIYEAINGEITVGRTDTNKLWVKTYVKLPNYENVSIYVEQGSTQMSVKDTMGNEKIITMPEPMLLTAKGNTFLPLRAIYEAVGGKITVGRTATNKLWVQTVVQLDTKRVTIYVEQGSTQMNIKEI
ncbi:MAG: C1 family peptidase [bacterium]